MARDFTGGSSDRVDIGTFSVTGAITIAAWVYWDSSNTSRDDRIVSKASGTSTAAHDWMLGLTHVSTVRRLRCRMGNSDSTCLATAGTINLSQWHLCGASYTDDGGIPNLWLDGAEIAATQSGGAGWDTAKDLPTNTNAVYIGNQPSATSSAPDGRIAHVAIWNVELTADEWASLYSGVAAHHIRPQNLVDYRPLFGVSTEPDITGTHGNATITGTTVVDGPPVSWGAPVIVPQKAAASVGNHTSTGALSAQAASVAGTANHKGLHTSTGALSAQAAAIAGTATASNQHPSTGALSAQAATVSGTATASNQHPATGALSAQSATVSGTATASNQHLATGALTAQSATVAGTATASNLHTSTGALAAQAASVSGTATNTGLHTSTGALAAGAATVAGTANNFVANTHPSTGALSAGAATVAGTATNTGLHTSTGALAAGAATVAGTATHTGLHTSTGALAAGLATVSGTATNTPAVLDPIARPDADTLAGAWLPSTGTDLFAMLDEVSADDADYIRATNATTCEISLSAVADPNTSTGQAFSYRAWSPEGNGLVVRLKQGATTIATWTHAAGALPATPTTYTQNLSAGECDAITDYTALSVEFEATV